MDIHINVFLWTVPKKFHYNTYPFTFAVVPDKWFCWTGFIKWLKQHAQILWNCFHYHWNKHSPICNKEQWTNLKNRWQSTNQYKQRVPNKTESILPATHISSPVHLLLKLMFYFILPMNLCNKCGSHVH